MDKSFAMPGNWKMPQSGAGTPRSLLVVITSMSETAGMYTS